MNSVLLQGVKGCVLGGTCAILAGLTLCSNNSSPRGYNSELPALPEQPEFSEINQQNQYELLGPLASTVAQPLIEFQRLSRFYPDTQKTYTKVLRYTVRFCRQASDALFNQTTHHKKVKILKKLLSYQKKIFEKLDDVHLAVSESVALPDMLKAIDDLKQTVTDVCLSLDV